MSEINELSKNQDNELVVLLKEGSHQAFEKLYNRYKNRIAFLCKNLSKEDAEEIVQNVFMTVWENRHQIDLQYSFSSYLFSIAKHQVYNTIRDKVAQKAFVEKYVQQSEAVEIMQDYDDSTEKMKEKMKRIINQFPDRQREIFKMSRTYKMTYKEIAEKLEISENTVDTSIRRSLNTLRSAFLQLVLYIMCSV